MNRWRSTWSPLLLGMLLMAVLVRMAGDGRDVSAAGSRQLIVPAAHFYPMNRFADYTNQGSQLYSNDNSTLVWFLAPVQFPVAYYATVEKLELMAYDYNFSGSIRVYLYKTKPAAANRVEMAFIDTGGPFVSNENPAIWVYPSINEPTVKPAEEAYLQLGIDPGDILTFYGVRVWYHPGT